MEDKKDVGVKPKVTGINATCGACGNAVSLYEIDFNLGYKFNFCSNCGERIDWSDLEKLVKPTETEGGSDNE